ncbi:MAG TPA: LysM peptidoglycan-binding domain-containing protein, partial [Candidatus Hydrogenedens sp.]|nr:LysM peptidoglycan-binding domain-containing protein [Candidatus Hydrogenedens sp.]
ESKKIEEAKVETENKSKTTEKVYVVKQGDTLSKIARENNVSLKSILESNSLKEDSPLRVGQKIVLSQNLTKQESVQSTKEVLPQNRVSLHQDKENKSNISAPSESLNVVEHIVQPGESLWSISKKYNTNIAMITQKNPSINSESLKVGTKLLVPLSGTLSSTEPKAMAATTSPKQQSTSQTKPATRQVEEQTNQTLKSVQQSDCIIYQVQPGDNLWLIARKNNVSVYEITQWNNMDKSAQLKIGQTLKIYPNEKQKVIVDTKKAGQISTASMENKKEEQTQINTYTVQKGDSLYTISKKTGTPIKKLLEINNFDKEKVLQIGENVRISQ